MIITTIYNLSNLKEISFLLPFLCLIYLQYLTNQLYVQVSTNCISRLAPIQQKKNQTKDNTFVKQNSTQKGLNFSLYRSAKHLKARVQKFWETGHLGD